MTLMIDGTHVMDPMPVGTGTIGVAAGPQWGPHQRHVVLEVHEPGEEVMASAVLTTEDAVALATRLLIAAAEARGRR